MEHYKSWGTLKKWLESNVCDELKGRVTFFLTRYHEVHNAYGRAFIRVDGEERAVFTWKDMYRQERERDDLWYAEREENDDAPYDTERYERALKSRWDENCTYSEYDFLSAVLAFRNMAIGDALSSDNFIIKTLAVLDQRVGKRTLQKIKEKQDYLNYPNWVKQFYLLRLA